MLAPYMIFLAAAVRFLHYALYGEPLLSVSLFISALIWMVIVGALGYRAMRANQMATQYSWAYDSSGLNWRAKGEWLNVRPLKGQTSVFFKVTLDQKKRKYRPSRWNSSANGRQGGPGARNYMGVAE